MEIRQLIVLIILSGLFMFGLISGGYFLQANNNVNETILHDTSLNRTFSNLQQNITGLQKKAESAQNATETEIPTVSGEGIGLESITSALKTFVGMGRGVWDLGFSMVYTYLGVNPVFFYGIVAIVILSIVLLGWSAYRSGR